MDRPIEYFELRPLAAEIGDYERTEWKGGGGLGAIVAVVAAVAIPIAAPAIAASIGLSGAIAGAATSLGASAAIASGVGAVAGSALVGAGLGALKAAAFDEDIGRGALTGGLSGGIGGFFSGPGASGDISGAVEGANAAGQAGSGSGGVFGGGAPLAPGTAGAPPAFGEAVATSGGGLNVAGTSGLGASGVPLRPELLASQPQTLINPGTVNPTVTSTLQQGNINPAVTPNPNYTPPAGAQQQSFFQRLKGRAAEGARETFSPENIAESALNTGKRAAGQFITSAATDAIYGDEGDLLDQQAANLDAIRQRERQFINERANLAREIGADARQIDPRANALDASNSVRTSGERVIRDRERQLARSNPFGTYERQSEAQRGRLDTARGATSAYSREFDTSQRRRQAGLQASAAAFPTDPGTSSYNAGLNGLGGMLDLRRRKQEDAERIGKLLGFGSPELFTNQGSTPGQ